MTAADDRKPVWFYDPAAEEDVRLSTREAAAVILALQDQQTADPDWDDVRDEDPTPVRVWLDLAFDTEGYYEHVQACVLPRPEDPHAYVHNGGDGDCEVCGDAENPVHLAAAPPAPAVPRERGESFSPVNGGLAISLMHEGHTLYARAEDLEHHPTYRNDMTPGSRIVDVYCACGWHAASISRGGLVEQHAAHVLADPAAPLAEAIGECSRCEAPFWAPQGRVLELWRGGVMSPDPIASTDLVEVVVPAGVGIEPVEGSPDEFQLVGELADVERLVLSIDVAAGRRRSTTAPRLHRPRPVLDDVRVTELIGDAQAEDRERIAELENELATANRRLDAALTLRGSPVADLVATGAVTRGPARLVHPDCHVPDCPQRGTHVHPRWEAAAARGELDGAHAAAWSVADWNEFVRAHHVSQRRAIAEVAAAAGADVLGLITVRDRPELAQALLDLVARKMASTATAVEPW